LRGESLLFSITLEPRGVCPLHEKVNEWEKSHEDEEREKQE